MVTCLHQNIDFFFLSICVCNIFRKAHRLGLQVKNERIGYSMGVSPHFRKCTFAKKQTGGF
jgi:hypothetical protein